jgi:hypothetical protein
MDPGAKRVLGSCQAYFSLYLLSKRTVPPLEAVLRPVLEVDKEEERGIGGSRVGRQAAAAAKVIAQSAKSSNRRKHHGSKKGKRVIDNLTDNDIYIYIRIKSKERNFLRPPTQILTSIHPPTRSHLHVLRYYLFKGSR